MPAAQHYPEPTVVAIDLHKWLNVPYDSAAAFTRHRERNMEINWMM